MLTGIQAGRCVRLFFALLLLAPASSMGAGGPAEQGDAAATVDNPAPPNILLIVVDDMGFSDLGAFGGEIPTPNLDSLALAGTRFTDFQVLPACSPTRATLLTGLEPHAVGFGSLAEEIADNQRGSPAYTGALPPGVATLPRLLKEGGYQSYMAGKWHLGFEGGRGPRYFGFDQSFALMAGGASHFADMRPAYAPDPKAIARYARNDQLLTKLPDNFHYSTQFYADQMIEFIGEQRRQPFFAYLSYTAPHWPLQAPDAAIAEFADAYGRGYEALGRERLERLKALGFVSDTVDLSPLPPGVPAWDSLSQAARNRAARAMAVYAAMIAEIDRHTGRVMAHLKAIGELENTVIVFLSDNGAEGHDLDQTWPGDMFPQIRAIIDQRFDHSTAAMGRPGSYTLYGGGWAQASSPHLRLYKGFPSEGGTRVAAFMQLPGTGKTPALVRTRVGVRDLMPTLLDLARVEAPEDLSPPLAGRSLVPLLTGGRYTESPIAIEFLGKYGVRSGDWKLLKLPPPYGRNEFTLYNLRSDPGESRDLAAQYPERVAALRGILEAYRTRYDVIHPDWVSGY